MSRFFDGESELAKRCGITNLWDGATTSESRRERIRAAVLERDPAIVWRGPSNKPETYAEAFARIYGETP
jgi:hypothetical protein